MKCNRFSVVLAIAAVAVAALALTTTSALANVITNPGFETTVPHANWNTFWGDTYTLGDWQATLYGDRLAYKTSGGNTGAYLGNNNSNPAGASNPTAFYQAVDATGVSGDYQFSFDYLNTDSDGTNNVVSWGIWGYPSPVDHHNFVNGNTIAFVHSQHTGNLIASGDFEPGTVGWTNHAAPTFTVPSGLDRIIVGLGSDEFRPGAGDVIGFDNVSLQEAGGSGGAISVSTLTNDESDIVNLGTTVVSAANLGSQAGGNTTVDINGISHPVASAANNGDGADLIPELTINSTFDGNYRSGQASAAGYTGDMLDLLGGIAGNGAPGPISLEISGLNVGTDYLFQGYWEANNFGQTASVTFEGTDTQGDITGVGGQATLISYTFTAGDSVLNADLSKTAGSDNNWWLGYSLQEAAGGPPPPVTTMEWTFDGPGGPDEQGWVDVLTSAVANSNTDFDAVDGDVFAGRDPQSGVGWVAPATNGAGGWNQRDGQNDPFVIRSPSFVLGDSEDLTFFLQGGVSGGPAPSNFDGLGDSGFLGLALRDDVTGDYVLSAGRPSNGDGYQMVSFTQAELAPFVGGTFTLDYIDDKKGGWGWGGIDSITVPIQSASAVPEPSTLALAALGLLGLGWYGRLRRRRAA